MAGVYNEEQDYLARRAAWPIADDLIIISETKDGQQESLDK